MSAVATSRATYFVVTIGLFPRGITYFGDIVYLNILDYCGKKDFVYRDISG